MIGLIDCNNFYASCERIFRPDLQHKPIVVLSNNDGCIIARSEEAKALNIDMASAFYKVRDQLKKQGVSVFSSNYPLYGSMSARVMRTLGTFTPNVEVYSIDEAFVYTEGLRVGSHIKLGESIRQRVYQWTGIPVCVGFSTTKTLAKIANRIAKKHTDNGVFIINDSNCANVLQKLDVSDVWGIGSKSAVKLKRSGILSAFDLYKADDSLIRSILGVTGLRTAVELRGQNAVLDDPPIARSVSSSRSFGKAVSSLSDLREALACYIETAYKKLKTRELYAGGISVYIKTNRHAKNQPQYANLAASSIKYGEDNLSAIIKIGDKLLQSVYRPGFNYIKTGVILSDLSENPPQPGLFDSPPTQKEASKLDTAFDEINQKFGSNAIFHAVQGTERKWKMKQNYLSPRVTTNWQEIPTIKI